jgi:2-succinyl-5-enolpyruvyl-6-hydroxy-3-cyclohexene-1-carboxylate synthase
MPIDFRNTNTVWASILVETLHRVGLTTAIICPGSRSTPLAIAFAQHPEIEAIPVLDERSAAFFALGMAHRTKRPAAIVCTSGTAGANFYPAVIEARESRVPLLVLTADRPPELRECNAGQTVDQQKLFGTYPNWYSEVAIPSLEPTLLAYLRQVTIQAWERSLHPVAGAVHLNLPFRDPLAPISQPEAAELATTFDSDNFFRSVERNQFIELNALIPDLRSPSVAIRGLLSDLLSPTIIIAGVAQPAAPQPYCEAIASLSKRFGLPVLAEGLSPVRNYADLNPYLISTYDLLLRNSSLAEKLVPKTVIRIGEMPTSKELRQWLDIIQPQQWIIDPGDRNLDPLHLKTTHLRLSVEQLTASLQQAETLTVPQPQPDYLLNWLNAEVEIRQQLHDKLAQETLLFEGKVSWALSQWLPQNTPIFIANSMPVRDVEWFWQPGNLRIQPHFNRGANGIDGTLSTALGMAYGDRSSILLTGDLALLHDTNGFLLRHKFNGHLTIVLINNNGGGIFEMLPIAQFDPPFEEFFATPQFIDFAQLCATYGIEYEQVKSCEHLKQRLNPLPDRGIRVLEVRSDRKINAQLRRDYLNLALSYNSTVS